MQIGHINEKENLKYLKSVLERKLNMLDMNSTSELANTANPIEIMKFGLVAKVKRLSYENRLKQINNRI